MKKRVLSVFFGLVLVSATISLPQKTYASKGLPFGGRIGFIFPCINGLFIFVITPDPKSIGPYIITPAVIPRAFYLPLIAHAIKGTYIPGIPCYIPPFIIIPTKGAIVEFGTSLLPSIPGAALVGVGVGAAVGVAAALSTGSDTNSDTSSSGSSAASTATGK